MCVLTSCTIFDMLCFFDARQETKVIIIDHISSNYGIVFPVEVSSVCMSGYIWSVMISIVHSYCSTLDYN